MKLHQTTESLEVTASRLKSSVFHDVDMSGTSFEDVNLSGAQLTNVNLTGLRLSNACLSNVAISDAGLQGMTINGILVTDLLRAYKAQQSI